MLTIEPQPAGPTFARCALRGAHAGPNGLPMDTNIYIYLRVARYGGPTRDQMYYPAARGNKL